MKECTLQEAVALCKKNGGTFYLKSAKKPCVYYIAENDKIVTKHEGMAQEEGIKIWAGAFFETWIYEPPKKSAFQEWNKKMLYWHICRNEHSIQDSCRKEGFNFALDLVKKELNLMPDEIIKIDQLKEP